MPILLCASFHHALEKLWCRRRQQEKCRLKLKNTALDCALCQFSSLGFFTGKCQDKRTFCPTLAQSGQCSGSDAVKSMCCRSCLLALTGKQDMDDETTRSRGSTDEMSLEDHQQAALDLFARQPNAPIYYPKGVPNFSPVIKGLLAEGKLRW